MLENLKGQNFPMIREKGSGHLSLLLTDHIVDGIHFYVSGYGNPEIKPIRHRDYKVADKSKHWVVLDGSDKVVRTVMRSESTAQNIVNRLNKTGLDSYRFMSYYEWLMAKFDKFIDRINGRN